MSAIHAATTDEKTYIRQDGRMSRFALAFPTSNVVWKARINQSVFDLSFIAEIVWDTQTGSYVDVVPGMMLWVGSGDGLQDIGKVRIRQSASATKVFFDPVANIRFIDNLYLTVVDDFEIESIPFGYDAAGVPFAGTDTAYVEQNEVFKPVAIMGGDAVVKLVDGEGLLLRDASDSWVPQGTIVSYSWGGDTADSIDDAATAMPTYHFNTVATHLIWLDLEASNGEVTRRYQKVVTWDDTHPTPTCKIETPLYGTVEDGGFECSVRAYAGVDRASVSENARVILYASKEYFGDDEISLGQSLGCENVWIAGWIVGKSISTDKATGDMLFTIRGTHGRMKEAMGQAFQAFRVTTTPPATWQEFTNPTLLELYWHFIVWRSTLAQVVDCYPPDTTLIYPDLQGVKGSLFEQIQSVADRCNCRVGTDAYGRLFCEVDPDALSDTDKDGLTEIMELTQDDRSTAIVEIGTKGPVSAVYASAIVIEGSEVEVRTVYSSSPGKIETKTGLPVSTDYLAGSQEESNSIAGRLFSKLNNNQVVYVNLPENNRLISLFPAQVLTVTIDADETPVNGEYTGSLVPTSIRYTYDDASGAIGMEVVGRFLQPEALSTNGVVPISDGEAGVGDYSFPEFSDGFDLDVPAILLPDLPSLPDFPNDESVEFTTLFQLMEFAGLWYTKDLDSVDPEWFRCLTLPVDTSIRTFLITPNKTIYVVADDSIYCATVDNPRFVPCLTSAWLLTEYPSGDLTISACGVDPVEPNKLYLIMGSGYLGSRTGNLWIGDNTGVTRMVAMNDSGGFGYWPSVGPMGDITVSGGNIMATYTANSGSTAVTMIFDASGASILDRTVFGDPAVRNHIRVGDSDVIYGWINQSLAKSEDNGLTWTSLTFATDTALWEYPEFHYPVACSKDGQRLMVCVITTGGYNNIEVSEDGGDTPLTMVASLPSDFVATSLINITDDKWIACGHLYLSGTRPPACYYTDDFGATWFPKYGNMSILLENSYQGTRRAILL